MSEHQRLQEQLHQQQLMREDHVEEDEEEEDEEVLQPGEYGGEEYYGEWSVCRSLLWDYHACHTDSTDSTERGGKEGLWLKEQILVADIFWLSAQGRRRIRAAICPPSLGTSLHPILNVRLLTCTLSTRKLNPISETTIVRRHIAILSLFTNIFCFILWTLWNRISTWLRNHQDQTCQTNRAQNRCRGLPGSAH